MFVKDACIVTDMYFQEENILDFTDIEVTFQ